MAASLCRRFSSISRRFLSQGNRFKSSVSGHAQDEYSTEKETHFGFENVPEDKKAQKVHEVFENVAEKYDVMNDLMSGGIHRIWKDLFIARINPRPNTRLLDVAGGTGDIAFRFINHIKQETRTGSAVMPSESSESDLGEKESQRMPYEVVVCDISQGMLDAGQKRAAALGYTGLSWICGDAQKLPFPEDHFDCYTIAFGIRNVVDLEKALSEAYRVLKPGGRFVCLEFSEVTNPTIRWMYDRYSFGVIPVMGQVVAGDWKSYQYLVESIRKFPDQETFKEMIEDAGFRRVTYENLTFGVTAIHSGFKI
ncbi:2-methoxy-6-polyprenyl-1,4-benzoquinol methylase, mitochondrial-like [Penaeus japonicus]|uniref:2-methoxy-6-polyprenyl-1,4-benzoquinol methylase, mitochondrial-like n=1 Tax=Penaeus japonicus TaxID=27405 RepID=UPI001C7154C5|nr:2-methoxy-6-polyprenyl-1,4-benzoquinol methylase, mitochondrial-like [Penaeus japonicus]